MSLREPIIVYFRLMKYNWQQTDWPEFRFDLSGIEGELLAFAEKSGQVGGLLAFAGFDDAGDLAKNWRTCGAF
jgi:Fic family protein